MSRNDTSELNVLLAAFDYKVGAMDSSESELVRGYNNLMCVPYSRLDGKLGSHLFVRSLAFGSPSLAKIFAMDVVRFIPLSVTEWLQDNLNGRGLQKARECKDITIKVAKELVESKAKYHAEGKGRRDIFSLLSTSTFPRM